MGHFHIHQSLPLSIVRPLLSITQRAIDRPSRLPKANQLGSDIINSVVILISFVFFFIGNLYRTKLGRRVSRIEPRPPSFYYPRVANLVGIGLAQDVLNSLVNCDETC